MLQETLKASLTTMGLNLSTTAQQQLLSYIELLNKWNQVYNLTAIREPEQMLTHHILDSLSLLPHMHNATGIIDVGTGAGLPGIPLAIARPDLNFKLIDSQQKKINFVQHVITSLQLTNVVALQQRIEKLHSEAPVDMVVSRAFASLQDYVNLISNICNNNTQIVAMKGRKAQVLDEQQQLPGAFVITQIQEVTVPGLDAERCLVFLQKQGE